MEKINWTERKSNKDILRLDGEERYMLEVIRKRNESLHWSCSERGWTVEAGHRGKNGG